MLLWTLEHCLGKEFFNKNLLNVWIRIYCAMLNVLVPAAIEEEKKLTQNHKSVFSYSTAPELKAVLSEGTEATSPTLKLEDVTSRSESS